VGIGAAPVAEVGEVGFLGECGADGGAIEEFVAGDFEIFGGEEDLGGGETEELGYAGEGPEEPELAVGRGGWIGNGKPLAREFGDGFEVVIGGGGGPRKEEGLVVGGGD